MIGIHQTPIPISVISRNEADPLIVKLLEDRSMNHFDPNERSAFVNIMARIDARRSSKCHSLAA